MNNTTPDVEPLLPLDLPPRRASHGARRSIRESLLRSDVCLAVLDDDPTGTQTVHDIPVYLDWSAESLTEALGTEGRVVYVSTNSRALGSSEATELAWLLGSGLRAAEEANGVRSLLASRSDSTLRGHYPAEVDGLIAGYGTPVDGVIVCPAFFEGGRYTVNDVHYVLQGSALVHAADTEFARDPVFGYRCSNLREWVVEKRPGLRVEDIWSVSLETIREGGPGCVRDLLMSVKGGAPIIVNALCYEDLDQFVLGLIAAESQGKRFVYRCAASLVKVRGGVEDRPLLTRQDVASSSGPGLVVVGSWVERTTEQLTCLLQESGVAPVELNANAGGCDQQEIIEGAVADAALRASLVLQSGRTAVVYTPRCLLTREGKGFAAVGRRIMATLCRVVEQISVEPSFIVAKGGITSIEIARTALRARRAQVLGQIAAGVPVWRLGPEATWSGVPYIVFPGNVGDSSALRDVVLGTL